MRLCCVQFAAICLCLIMGCGGDASKDGAKPQPATAETAEQLAAANAILDQFKGKPLKEQAAMFLALPVPQDENLVESTEAMDFIRRYAAGDAFMQDELEEAYGAAIAEIDANLGICKGSSRGYLEQCSRICDAIHAELSIN